MAELTRMRMKAALLIPNPPRRNLQHFTSRYFANAMTAIGIPMSTRRYASSSCNPALVSMNIISHLLYLSIHEVSAVCPPAAMNMR